MRLGRRPAAWLSDYQRALTWYERLLGSEPAFPPKATEAVGEFAAVTRQG
jgi:hypothetical protein